MDAESSNKRIINVSNRLPVKICPTQSTYTFQSSEGGLATSLSSVFSDRSSLWIGWPGAVVTAEEQDSIIEELGKMNLSPIFLTQNDIHNYYEGFSNETLWPLFHYFPTYSKYNEEHWQSYVSVNRKFADEIINIASADDIIWVHDYQLMLVPQMVREAIPNITIGYFQHIPFPDYEIFRALPWKVEILNGLLGADTIGFQTDDDTDHFIRTACRILGMISDENRMTIGDRTVYAEAFPISIDFDKFERMSMHEETDRNVAKICKMVKGKMALSIDRLDYSKGILQRLRAFDLFLARHPEWHEQITFVHLVVPSRDNVSSYKDLKEEMDKLITMINGKYATIGWQPIQHFYRAFDPNMLSALYRSAHLALVTPLRDGMNLVSKEYVASNVDLNGVLILGEAAGAAKELKEALIVNPNDIYSFAETINRGLIMPDNEKRFRMANMRVQIKKADIFRWAESFLMKLTNNTNKQQLNVCIPVSVVEENIRTNFDRAHKRLLLLDYDGTLMPFFKNANDARPDKELIAMLNKLSRDKRNNIVVISGRDMHTLEKWLGHLKIEMVGEHGAWFREYGKQWYSIAGLDNGWKEEVRQVFQAYSSITPGSSTEEKDYSIAWHYRSANAMLGDNSATDMVQELKMRLKNRGLDVIRGNKVIEVKSNKINKGKAALKLMGRGDYDFVMAIGDDRTDEDMFKVLPKDAVSIKVGGNISSAVYWQASYSEVRELLMSLTRSDIVSARLIRLPVNKAS